MGWFAKSASTAELESAKKRVEELSVECANLKQVASRAHQAEAASNALRTELETAKAKLREQVAADLMLVSARIIMDTLRGEKPKAQDVALQQNLYQQQLGLGQAQSPFGSGGYIFGGTGDSLFGSIFGH